MSALKKALPDAVVADDLPPLIKQGVYELAFVEYRTANMFRGKAPKLIMDFRIISMGQFFECIVPRYYNVQKVLGKPQLSGRFKCGKKGSFLREYLTLFPNQLQRLDRVPMSAYANAIIEGKIRTVTQSGQKVIPKPLQYSCISELLRVVS